LFVYKQKDGLEYLISTVLEPHIKHCFTTRKGGVSENKYASLNFRFRCGDPIENVRENVKKISEACGFNGVNTVTACQTHGSSVKTVTVDDCGKGVWKHSDIEDADAIITNVKKLPLMGFFADCPLVLIYDMKNKAAASVHCGWRSASEDIITKALNEMKKIFNTDTADVIAAVGPSIQRDCFEVGDDVKRAFSSNIGAWTEKYFTAAKNDGKYMCGLQSILKVQMEQNGIKSVNTDICEECMVCSHERFFSHRYTKGNRGVNAAIIQID